MNAYIIVAGDFIEHGGMDRANLEFARYVASRGHKVHLVAHRVSEWLSKLHGICSHYVPRPLRSDLLGQPGLEIAGRLLAARLPAQTRVVVNGGNCAIAAVNWVHFVHHAYRTVTTNAGIRGRVGSALGMWSEGRAIKRARLIIANSQRTCSDLMTTLAVGHGRLQTVYCGVDASEFGPADDTSRGAAALSLGFRPELRRIVFIGALGNERKGFSTVFDAWRRLAPRWEDVELVVVGAGSLLPSLIAQSLRENLGERVHFLGQRNDVGKVLQSSDVLVAPALYEPYGLNIAEALATGLPVIASARSGASEIIGAELRCLLLEDPRSTDELVAKLHMWRNRSAYFRRISVDGSEKIRKHNWESMSADIYRLVEAAYG